VTGCPFCFLSPGINVCARKMVAEKMEKDESSRTLLDKLEGEWDSPSGPTPEMQAALDAAAERLVDSLNPPPVSVPTMAELDSGWGEEDDEDDDLEPELPGESLEARRQKRRVKAEMKKARRKARLEAQRSKQKGKQKKARPAQKPSRSPKGSDAESGVDDREAEEVVPARTAASKPMLSKTNQWMLAVAVIIFLAAAIFAAVVAR